MKAGGALFWAPAAPLWEGPIDLIFLPRHNPGMRCDWRTFNKANVALGNKSASKSSEGNEDAGEEPGGVVLIGDGQWIYFVN